MISVSKGTAGHVGPAGSSLVPDGYLYTLGRALLILLNGMRGNKT